jgi:hypothetical protein
VLEIEKERQHAEAEQPDAEAGQQGDHGRAFAMAAAIQQHADDDHRACHPPAEEQVDGDLPAPDVQERIDQRVVTRGNEFGHTR